MAAYVTTGSSGLVPSVVIVVCPDGAEEEHAEHLTPAEAIALGTKLFEMATMTGKFIEITRDDTPSGGM
ncbi:hypothetical protein E3O19_01380 [Cryobacterium algoritolerans]|uniref:Uncharacterized protein n=1 Tax=Cryobacterium algoritolerans TaxID=1259184 RepID=A0A4R8X0A5_9MICO|nr:hypothetical protein [Cryobacterium algoritolerans]TFC20050.1 hypothetical protein E3O19_01380 [Cryobacterium algoritolerans]